MMYFILIPGNDVQGKLHTSFFHPRLIFSFDERHDGTLVGCHSMVSGSCWIGSYSTVVTCVGLLLQSFPCSIYSTTAFKIIQAKPNY